MVADLTPFVMTVRFYTTNSEHNRINKELTNEYILNDVYLLDAQNILNPSIRVDSNNVFYYNYCYIEEFHRYYYIDDVTEEFNGLAVCKLSVDVLMSYKTDILNTVGLINHADQNQYLHDDNIVTNTKCTKQIVTFPQSLPTDTDYVLIVSGGHK